MVVTRPLRLLLRQLKLLLLAILARLLATLALLHVTLALLLAILARLLATLALLLATSNCRSDNHAIENLPVSQAGREVLFYPNVPGLVSACIIVP